MNTPTQFLLCHEQQIVEWHANDPVPEVIPQYSVVLETYTTKPDAVRAVEAYLGALGAKPQWSDVRPIETCACCGRDILTAQSHMTLALLEEEGPEYSPTTLAAEYPARFCIGCVPIAPGKTP